MFKGVGGLSGRRLGRLGRRGCLLVDDFCGAGVGFRVFEGVGGGAGRRLGRLVACVRLRLGGARLRSRLWVVSVTRKDV